MTNSSETRNFGKVRRKGVSSDFRRDAYFYFVQCSWLQFFMALIGLYLCSNIIFACLYLNFPQSIEGSIENSFLDSFFFSIQTMSTIGYGKLSPATLSSNLLVTLQAIFGILFTALSTGLIFAKASKPKPNIVFSDSILISEIDEKKYLMFRVGNTRGNDIVDAAVTFSVLIDHVSKEGHHFRKVVDLDTVRGRTPFFSLSWTVMHEITNDSPVFDLLDESKKTKALGFLALLIGHDGTYSQTVYVRKTYELESLKKNKHFVDIITPLSDGSLEIDYSKFHEIKQKDE